MEHSNNNQIKQSDLVFSTFNDQIVSNKVIILDRTFIIPESVFVSEFGIHNKYNVPIDQYLIKQINHYISKYNILKYKFNLQNNFD